MTASRFLSGNREAELKPSTFSSLLLFPVFPLLLTRSDIVPLSEEKVLGFSSAFLFTERKQEAVTQDRTI